MVSSEAFDGKTVVFVVFLVEFVGVFFGEGEVFDEVFVY